MTLPITSTEFKSCCAALYESDWARALLGESLHPGGLSLTGQLADMLALRPGMRVLDVAAGSGTSAAFLAQRYRCQVTALDLGVRSLTRGRQQAAAGIASSALTYVAGDAERLPFADGTFDAVISECAYCTFPDKPAAAAEFARVVRVGGKLGFSDMVVTGALPESLQTLLAWIACIAAAQPVATYRRQFSDAGFSIAEPLDKSACLLDMVDTVRSKLLALDVLSALKGAPIPAETLGEAKAMANAAEKAVRAGVLGYALLTGERL